MPNPHEDSAAVQKCLAGDIQSYGALVDRYSGRIINLAYMMINDRHDAEDIAQEAFIRAYRALGKFERKAKFSSWLYQIALNLCRDCLKARGRHAKSMEDEQLDHASPGERSTAPRQVLQVELSERMRLAVGKLPVLYREAFILRHLEGREYDEVAEITGVTADTARVRAYRARELLREALSPEVDTFWREKAAKEKSGAKAKSET